MYQVLAYAMRYGCDTVALAYPMPSGVEPTFQVPPVFRIDACDGARNITVELKLVRLWPDAAAKALPG